ncbi:MAG TPA: universal stress protein [Gemmatimonadaceae bacterium]|nr:universal stress protein [Gemmatimonadaceae bacterium]
MPRTILVQLDGSTQSEMAITHAASLARGLGASLHLVRVHLPVIAYATAEAAIAIPDPDLDEQVRAAAEKWLIAKAAAVKATVKLPVTFELRTGAPTDEVVRAAAERDASFIVCTTHGHGGWAPQWVGSVTDAIIRHAPCPVIAMSEKAVAGPPRIENILVPLDGTDTAAAILPYVRDLARTLDARVDLFRVVAPPWVGDALNALQSGDLDRFGIDAAADAAKVELDRAAQDLVVAGVHATSVVSVDTNPTRAILDRIAEVQPDLVAIATHGRGLSRLFMGSVADKVLRAGGKPVLSWRAPRHEQPEHQEAGMFATPFSSPAA